MKKITSLLFALMFLVSGITFAQTTGTSGAKTATKKEVKASSSTHLKKDGTADKRYKDNKKTAAKVHTKKDGTPDMRYKENK